MYLLYNQNGTAASLTQMLRSKKAAKITDDAHDPLLLTYESRQGSKGKMRIRNIIWSDGWILHGVRIMRE